MSHSFVFFTQNSRKGQKNWPEIFFILILNILICIKHNHRDKKMLYIFVKSIQLFFNTISVTIKKKEKII